MGWFDDFLDLAKVAGSAYYAIATKPEVRKKIAGKALDSFSAPGTIGEKLVSGIDAITFRAGYNPNEIPQVGKDVIRTAGDVIGLAESQLPGIDAIHAGLTSATELAAGRDPAHLKDLAIETAVAFAPPGVGEAYAAYKALSDLPVADAAIKREVIAPPKPKSVPTQTPVPAIPDMPKPKPERVAPKAEPKIPAEVPVPKPPSAKPPSISNTYDLFDKSRAKFEPSQISKFDPPAEARSYSRVERLDNLINPQQQEIQPFLPHLVGLPQYAKLKRVKRRAKKTK